MLEDERGEGQTRFAFAREIISSALTSRDAGKKKQAPAQT